MKNQYAAIAILFFLMSISNVVMADDVADTSFPIVAWVSQSAGDMVTIENGTGAALSIVINVASDGSSDPAGVNLQNCGETTHIDASSSAICMTSDPNNPVTFSSDKNKPASGTYQIKQQVVQPTAQ